jgi:hypothetical protein
MFGPALQHREASRDARLVAWMESLRCDTVFGWRQLQKNPSHLRRSDPVTGTRGGGLYNCISTGGRSAAASLTSK